MVSVVTGSGAGLVNSSKDVLGGAGELGNAATGRAGERVTVNAATGNLVIQDRDEYLVGVGPDVDLLRTYNSVGGWDGDNGDGWRMGYYRRVSGLTGGAVNTAGSIIKRTDADGHEASYYFNTGSGKYFTGEGSGQFDSLSFGGGVWTWTDGDTGTTETYASVVDGTSGGATYRLTQISDAEGHLVKVDYDINGLIRTLSTFKSGSATADEVVTLSYTGTQLLQISAGYKDEQGALKTRSLTGYTYTDGRLSQVTTDLSPEDNSIADGKTYTTTYTYDANGRLQTLTQKDGSKLTLDYWGDGRVKSITDDQNRVTGFVYDTTNRITTVTDALGQVTTLKYLSGDNDGQLGEISGAALGGASFKQTYTYDNGDVVTSTNAQGEVTTYEYAGAGKLARRTDAAGNVLERIYTSEGLLATETTYTVADPDGVAGQLKASGARTTQYLYDTTQIAKRRLAYTVGPRGEVTRYIYNGLGQLARQVQYTAALFTAANPNFSALESWVNGSQAQSLDRQIIEYDYDLRGQVKEERHYTVVALSSGVPVGTAFTKTNTVYDAFGRLLSSKDTNGNGSTYLYDGLNRLSQSIDANSAVTLYSYADGDRKTTIKLANGLTTVQLFDTAGRLVSSDVLGASTQAALGVTRYFYDALGRLRRMQDATGVSTYTLYDVSGRKSADIAANGQLTEYLYDAAGRLIQSVAYATPVGATALATLSDAQGQPTAKTVADLRPAIDATNDRITTAYYDKAGRLAATLDADGFLTKNQYDGTSALTSQTRYANAVAVVRLDPTQGTTRTVAADLPSPTADATRDRTTRNLYDASGRLAGQVNGEGGLTVWTYDAAGHMLSQLRRSQLLTDTQRSSGTLAELTALAPLADDEFTQWVYDGDGRQIALLDAEGNLTEYRYDTAGRPSDTVRYLTQARKPVGPGLNLIKRADLDNLRLGLGTPLTTSRSYNSRGLLEKETASDGTVTFYDYDELQRLKTTTLAWNTGEAVSQSIAYDDWGRVQIAKTTGDATEAITWYDAAGRRIRVKDAQGNTTFYYYDAQGRQVYAILRDPLTGGEVTETIYSSFSEVQTTVTHSQRLGTSDCASLAGGFADATLNAKVAALGNASVDNRRTVSYNRRGLVQQAIDALGYKADTTYNAFGEVDTVTTDVGTVPGGPRLTTSQLYDRRGLLLQDTRSATGLSATVQRQYDALARLKSVTDELARLTSYAYTRSTGGGRKLLVTDAAGTTTTTYDALERVIARTDHNGNTVSYIHDAVNRKLTMTTAEGIQVVTEYNRHGQTYKVTDGTGAATLYGYDKHGNLLTVTDALGNVTQNSYDLNDNLTQVIQGLRSNGTAAPVNDGSATTTTFTFDAANRVLTQTVNPGGLKLKTSYEYDGQGRRVKITDAAGTVTSQSFTAKGELKDVIVDVGTGGLNLKTSYQYDAQSRTIEVLQGSGTAAAVKTKIEFDAFGRQTALTVDPDGIKLKTRYEYDSAGQLLVQRNSVDQVVARYRYDGAGRLQYSIDATGTVTKNYYDGESHLTASLAFAQRLATGWDSKTEAELGTLLGALTAGAADALSTNAYDKDGRLAYTVDGVGNVTGLQYDKAGRVIARRQCATPIVTANAPYTLAEVKAKLSVDDTKDGVARYAYDAVGRQRFAIDAEGYVTETRYDGAGRVVATVQHEARWTGALANAPTEATLAASYSPTRSEFTTDVEGLTGVGGVWENGRLKMISEPVANGGWAGMNSPRVRPVGSTLQVDLQPMQAQQYFHVLLVDGSGVPGRVALILKPNSRVYAQVQTPANQFIETDIGAYAPDTTYTVEIESNAKGARFFMYAKGAARDSGINYLLVEPTLAWQTVRAQFAVNRTSTLPGQTITYVDNMEERPPQQGRTTQFTYDAAGRQRFAVDAEGFVTETRYDDAANKTTTLRYANRLSGSSPYTPPSAAPTLASFTADVLTGLGTAISVTQGLDRAGRLSTVTDGSGVTQLTTYDAAGHIETEVQASNLAGQSSTTRYRYNAAGQRISATHADGTAQASTTRYDYDSLGRLWHEVDARGVALAEGNGEWERAERVRRGFAEDLSTLNSADKTSAQAALLAAFTTTYEYDGANRVIKTTDALGGVTATDYDAFGNASVITDARGYKRYQVWDKAGHLAQAVDAERYLSVYSYDAFGNLKSTLRVDAKVQGTLVAGQAIQLTNSPPATGAYVLTSATLDHLTSREYDRNSHLLRETDAENYVEGSVGALDAFGQRLSGRNKLGAVVTYTYDRLGRLLTETLPVQAKDSSGQLQNVVNEYRYDSRGNRVTSIEAKGLAEQRTTQMAYDANDRLVRRVGMSYLATATDGSTSTVTPADAYRYDARGNLIDQISHGQLQADGTTVSGGKRSVAWYDALNQKTLEISADRVAARFSYDAAGNQVVQTVYATRVAAGVSIEPTGATPAIAIDALNDRTLRSRYDALSRKIETSLDNLYAWSSGDGTSLVISGLTPQNTVLQSFFYDAVGNLTERRDGRGNSSFEYFDGNGRRVLSIDARGALVAWDYERATAVATRETRYAGMPEGGGFHARQAASLSGLSPTNNPEWLRQRYVDLGATPENGHRVTEFSLDRLDRVTERRVLNVAQDTVDASGTRSQSMATAITQYQYNGLGVVTQTKELAAQVGATQTWQQTDVSYDGLGRETHREAPGYVDYLNQNVRPATDVEYDGLGNVKRRLQRGTNNAVETDDRITLSAYDANGLLVQTTDAAGAVTTYSYDANGNLSRRVNKDVRRSDLTTKRDVIVSYESDAAGRIVVEKHWESDKAAAAETRKTRYNAFGEISAKGIGDGWEEFAEYTTLGKVMKTNAGDGAIKFYVYDANGNMTREIRGNGDNSAGTGTSATTFDLRTLTIRQATTGKLSDASTDTLPLYSRISVYDAKNQLIKTIDPQIDVLKNSVSLSSLYNQSWVPAWSAPSTQASPSKPMDTANISYFGNGWMRIYSPGATALGITFPGVWSGSFQDPSGNGLFLLQLSPPSAGAPPITYQFYYVASDTSNALIHTTSAGTGSLTIDQTGRVFNASNSPNDGFSTPGEAWFYAPRYMGISNMWVTPDAGGAYQPFAGVRYYGQGDKVSLITLRANGSNTVSSYTITYDVDGGGSGRYRVSLNNATGAVTVNDATADPGALPLDFYIQGRQVPSARLKLNGTNVTLTGQYMPAAGGRPAYTKFSMNARGLLSQGVATSYSLEALDASGTALNDELGAPLIQSGRVVMDVNGTPQVQQKITALLTSEQVTISRLQSFNAFGEVSEERDERVAERMLAAINDDRKAKGQAALSALTAEQLAAARTTLQYNVLGQLVAKIDPETFITAENGYRFRSRPVTRYGYDLLGRHTTTLEGATLLTPNGNLSRSYYSPGAQDEDASAAFDAAGGSADTFNATGGGITRYARDIFGDVRQITDALSGVVMQDFDAMGRLTTVTRKAVTRADATGTFTSSGDLQDSYAYDELGQRIRYVNALDNKKLPAQQLATTTDYDALGRVVKTVTAGGTKTEYSYSLKQVSDAAILSMDGAVSNGAAAAKSGGYVKTTLQADGRSVTDEVEYFGHTTRHKDLSGATFTYQYNSAGQIVRETSTVHVGQSLGKDVSYSYYANGYIQSLRDNTLSVSAEYAYDNAGNRVYEAYFKLDPVNKDAQGKPVKLEAYQNSTIIYDELNRIVRVQDPNLYDIRYEFDAAGNRRLVDSVYWDGAAGLRDRQTYWYAYDALNRFVVTKGQLSTTNVNGDLNRFATATRGSSLNDVNVSIVPGTGDGIRIGYDKLNRRMLAEYTYANQKVTEVYGYSSDGYLQTTKQNNVLSTVRVLDVLGRTTSLLDKVNNQETQSDYDADNRLVQQRFFDGKDSSKNYKLDFSYYDTTADSTSSVAGKGALAKTLLTPTSTPSSTTTTTYTYEYWDGALQRQITKTPTSSTAGYTYFYYDVDGHIRRTSDSVAAVDNTYYTTASGLVLRRDRSNGSHHFFYYADDHRVGDVSDTSDDIQRVSYAEQLAMKPAVNKRSYYRKEVVGQEQVNVENQDGTWTEEWRNIIEAHSTADFDQNYEPINDNYPGAAASSYTVRGDGESLAGIAQALWGDRSMWYLIADANGLALNSALKAGQLLVIPNKVTNIHNSSQTWRPYNAGEAMGRTDPTVPVPPPPAKKGCGAVGTFIMAAVAVAVTAYLGPLASGVLGNSVLGYGVAAAAGSIASQGVGMLTGDVQQFSWKAVGQAALGGAIAGGVQAAGLFSNTSVGLQAAGRALVSTGANLVLHGDWSWRDVMISAVSAGAGAAIGDALSSQAWAQAGRGLGQRFASGVAASMTARALTQGHRSSYDLIFATTLGNAIGESLAAQTQSQSESPYTLSGRGVRLGGSSGSTEVATTGYGIGAFTSRLGDRAADRVDAAVYEARAQIAQRAYAGSNSSGAENEVLPYRYLALDGTGHNTPQTAVLIEGRATRDYLELDDYDVLDNRTGFTAHVSAAPPTMSYGDQMFMLGQVGVGFAKALPDVPSNLFNGVTGLAKLSVDGNARLLNMAGVVSDDRLNAILAAKVPQAPMVLEASKDPRYAAAQKIGMFGGDVVWGAVAPGAVVKTIGYAAETATAVRTMVGTGEALAAEAVERAALLESPLGSVASDLSPGAALRAKYRL